MTPEQVVASIALTIFGILIKWAFDRIRKAKMDGWEVWLSQKLDEKLQILHDRISSLKSELIAEVIELKTGQARTEVQIEMLSKAPVHNGGFVSIERELQETKTILSNLTDCK